MVARAALALTAWTERWIPDAFIFALLATVLVVRRRARLDAVHAARRSIDAWGNGFWDLIPFTLQMSLIIITGHVLATSAPMGAAIRAHRRVAANAARRGGAGHVLRAGELVVQLGLQPDLQRGAGARSGAARRRRGLPRARGGELSRPRQHLGAGAQRIGGAADGDARRVAAADPRHRRRRRRSCRAASSRSATRSFSGKASSRCSIEIVVVTLVMWLATPPARPRAHRGAISASTSATTRCADRGRRPAPVPPGAWLEHSPIAAGVGRRHRRHLPRALFHARAAEPLNAITLNIVNLVVPAASGFCSTARRRG